MMGEMALFLTVKGAGWRLTAMVPTGLRKMLFGKKLSPEEYKELDEAFAAYGTKARTFSQSRQLQRAKGKSRGFYPVERLKEKGKARMGKVLVLHHPVPLHPCRRLHQPVLLRAM